MSYTIFVLAWMGFNLLFGALSAYAASRWGRDPFGWLLLGAVLGPIGFFALFALHLDDKRRPKIAISGTPVPQTNAKRVHLLLAVDGSFFSAQAVKYLVDTVNPDEVEVSVLTVLPLELQDAATASESSPIREDLCQEMETNVGSACETLRQANIPCRPIVRFGDPADEILRLATEESYAGIILGRRGRGRIGKFLLGSVSDKVVKEAACPVTVVGQ